MNLPTRKTPSCDKLKNVFLAEMQYGSFFSDLLYLTNICDTTADCSDSFILFFERVYSFGLSLPFKKGGGTSQITYQRISENIFTLTRHVIFSKSVNQ